jgi:hypothetical protein
MKNAKHWLRHSLLASACFATLAAIPSHAQTLPTDVKPTCTISPANFAKWFESGTVTANGIVNPANSITFNGNSNCAFFLWSEQMFLWATSPAPKSYGGGGGRVFDSPVFFDVSPPDANNVRVLIPNTGTNLRNFSVRIAQKGPNGLPIVFDKAGKMLDVVQPPAGTRSKLQLQLPNGTKIEPSQVKVDKSGNVQFNDKDGKPIDAATTRAAKPLALQASGSTVEISKIIASRTGQALFLNAQGQVIDVEQGQAGGNGVLMTQQNSLVYYSTQVNDVFAYFLTGAKDGKITPAPTTFPTTQAALNQVVAFAKTAPPPYTKQSFPDGIALAIELKSAWVEAASLPNGAAGYITMNATIPTYTKTSTSLWTQSGSKQALLAMVGIHVVGSANGHPEMIWASFEHFGNAPNAAYTYTSTSGNKTVNQNTSGGWLFTKNGSAGPFNVEYMNWVSSPASIQAATAGTPPPPPGVIAASDTLRENPFGTPSPTSSANISLNTDVISINNSVISQLLAGDIRKSYYMIGSTWTIGGKNPGAGGVQVGTNVLANTSMETYQQPNNCFFCHQSATSMLGGLSHIYGTNPPQLTGIKPLF